LFSAAIAGWKGHLWQARFGSSVLDGNHLIAAVTYIERNPVRAGIVRDAWEYPWSSAAYHTGKAARDRLVESDDMLRELVGDWKSYLQEDDQEGFLKSVRRDSFVNRLLGDEAEEGADRPPKLMPDANSARNLGSTSAYIYDLRLVKLSCKM
jgi:hypothetical protein